MPAPSQIRMKLRKLALRCNVGQVSTCRGAPGRRGDGHQGFLGAALTGRRGEKCSPESKIFMCEKIHHFRRATKLTHMS